MANSVNIIGDIAGRFDELMKLLNMMPPGHIISVGDLIDRGPKSREVIEFFRQKSNDLEATVLMGNHEHILVDYFQGTEIYPTGCWAGNGGKATLKSFSSPFYIATDVVNWFERLRRYIFPFPSKNILVSHSFVAPHLSLKKATIMTYNLGLKSSSPEFEDSIIWNRKEPVRRNYFQIAGHNSQFGFKEFSDDQGLYALCIDNSRNRKLTGINLREDCSYDVYSVNYFE